MTATLTSVDCMHCGRTCGSLAGLSAHMRSMHPDKVGNQPGREAPPEAATPASNGIVWEDPPTRGGRVLSEIVGLVPQLRRNPGKWARLYTWPGKTSAGGMRNQLTKRDDLADIEFSANAVDGGSALYGRYTEAE